MSASLTDSPWRNRIEVGLRITDRLGPHWVVLDGEDFYDRLELAALLTDELSIDWVPVLCYCGRAERPVSVMEIAQALFLNPGDVSACLTRLEKEKLVEATAQGGTYVFAVGRRVSRSQEADPPLPGRR